MVQTPAKSISLEEFLKLPETEPASEYIDGQIIQKPMPQGQHSAIRGTLVTTINAVTEANRLALALPELRCTFGGRSIVPDVAVFRWDRLPVNEDGIIANIFNAHPDWTIEILSPEQSSTRVTSNILHCIDYGCQLGWLIDPNEQLVQIYSTEKHLSSLENSEDLLPTPDFVEDLRITVGQLFGWLRVQ
jgi:Uma2 family endonuclease